MTSQTQVPIIIAACTGGIAAVGGHTADRMQLQLTAQIRATHSRRPPEVRQRVPQERASGAAPAQQEHESKEAHLEPSQPPMATRLPLATVQVWAPRLWLMDATCGRRYAADGSSSGS